MAITRKPAATKKTTAEKAPVKTSTKPVSKAPSKPAPKVEKLSGTQLMEHLMAATGLDKSQIKSVMLALSSTMMTEIGKKGPGEFMFPGLFKIVTIHKPATKARKGISPFTGEETMFKAKPASIKVKIRPMKKLKDAASA